jgi:hypothetical protein
MQVVWCAAINELKVGNEYRIAATMACAGVAFAIAGFTMLIGMFVCCCCKAPAPEEPMPVKNQVHCMYVCVCVICVCVWHHS